MDKRTKRVVKFVKERDWEQFHNPKDLAVSLTLEAAEVLEHFQWKNPEEMKKHLKDNKEDVSEELADVLYWVLLMSHYFDIDLEQAFEQKMQQNEAKYPIKKARGKHSKYTAYQND
ncbi:nucleotide pyrophosphohydrolase [Candidatus Saccharibacteria bacterium]|nr:nucleotide pyrophosphohydrolase [Candidatus Saccharibacteria bacterium]